MEYDFVVVGAGPAGLATAIKLKQRLGDHTSVCVVEKASEVGGHILSGNVFDPVALTELFPDWMQMSEEERPPLDTPVTRDEFYVMFSETSAVSSPIPSMIDNHGNYIISLGKLTQWLGTQAENLGVEIFPGFAASGLVVNEDQSIGGILTGEFGIGKDGQQKDTYQPSMKLLGKQTIFAEGARGSLSEQVMERFNLRENCEVQTFGLGMKEVWEVPPEQHEPGLVVHGTGWPLDSQTYGGAFLYHMNPNLVLIGYVVGLDYKNPYLSPYSEFQRFKHHDKIRSHLEGGKCISYGARVINEGGLQSVPKLTFPGGMLVGCSAGFVNVPRIKGSHTAIKSGIVAGEALANAFEANEGNIGQSEIEAYEDDMKNSWVWDELKQVRNVRPSFHKGLYAGMLYSGLSLYLLKGREPWTFSHGESDAEHTKSKDQFKPIEYPKPDGSLSFDLLSNLQRSGTDHEADQPAHLRVKDGMEEAVLNSLEEFDGPEQRFCPARVYEFVDDENGGGKKLQINAQNCLHCKTCDIKTPSNYIRWTVPEGGGGPAYQGM